MAGGRFLSEDVTMKRSSGALVVLGAICAVLAGCSRGGEVNTTMNLDEVRGQLQALSEARILLGHQSVGRDVLQGVRSLATEAGVNLNVERIDGLPAHDGPGLFHSEIGENGDPDAKCEAFGRLLTRPERPQYDLAMMKFCYADLGDSPANEAERMLQRYSKLVADLREQRPDVRLVHISMPLRAESTGWKAPIKRLLGREAPGDRANAVRNVFNDGLRAKYAHEPFFDIAALESTYVDGSRSEFSFEGRTIYTLAREYTHDGGHLNGIGQRRAAIEFVRTLASALRQPSS